MKTLRKIPKHGSLVIIEDTVPIKKRFMFIVESFEKAQKYLESDKLILFPLTDVPKDHWTHDPDGCFYYLCEFNWSLEGVKFIT